MNVLELFAGIGGLSLGLERAGMRVVGQVEIDLFCRAVLTKHWPEVPKHDDVRTAIRWWRGEPRPRVDVVAGGYPCQPESVAGRRRSTSDERWLWPAMARVVAATRPRYVIGENVPGHRARGLRFVLRDLERLGYAARAGTLAASEVGAPHRRQRLFILAELADADREPGGAWGSGDATQGQSWGHPDPGGVSRHVADPTAELASWWAAESGVGRVAHGVPHRVERLTGLGNAVVPQVAEAIGRLLMSGAWRDA